MSMLLKRDDDNLNAIEGYRVGEMTQNGSLGAK